MDPEGLYRSLALLAFMVIVPLLSYYSYWNSLIRFRSDWKEDAILAPSNPEESRKSMSPSIKPVQYWRHPGFLLQMKLSNSHLEGSGWYHLGITHTFRHKFQVSSILLSALAANSCIADTLLCYFGDNVIRLVVVDDPQYQSRWPWIVFSWHRWRALVPSRSAKVKL